MKWSGFSLVELAVVLVVMGVLGGVAHKLVRKGLETQRSQQQAVEGGQAVRFTLSLLATELRDLDATEPFNGDIVTMSPTSIAYRSTMNAHFLCSAPSPPASTLIVAAKPWFGVQALAASDHGIMILTDPGPESAWVTVRLRSVTGARCEDGRSGLALGLDAPLPPSLVIPVGAPVRGFQVTELRLYRDEAGASWLGQRTAGTDASWRSTQPVAGPLSPGGLQFDFRDDGGATTTSPSEVASVAVQVFAGTASGETEIWLRGNRRP